MACLISWYLLFISEYPSQVKQNNTLQDKLWAFKLAQSFSILAIISGRGVGEWKSTSDILSADGA
jgi:hypothetical protein